MTDVSSGEPVITPPSSWSSDGNEVDASPALPPAARPAKIRMNWQLKALLPVAAALLNGLLLFVLLTVSLDPGPRHSVIAIATAGAFVICAIIMATLGFMVRRPMLELQQKIARVRQGDLNVEVNFSDRNDEICDLGSDFNLMVRQLRESREEIQRLHRTQMSRAEHLATLGELAAGLAHEIRNPLAGIAGVIEIIGRDLPPTSPAVAVVKDVRLEIVQINRILTDLLETARPHRPQVCRSNLNTTVEHAVMLARQQVLSKPIKIELQKAPDLPEVEHDSGQIHQVLLNLLLNAVQAMEGAGTVRVEIGSRDDCATVVVSDNGRGISPQHLPNIFRPFYTTKGNGTGLGLSLARRIVEEHHGRIEVSSVVGQGSKFEVVLPFSMPAAEVAAT